MKLIKELLHWRKCLKMPAYNKPIRPYMFDCYYRWMIDNNSSKIYICIDTTVPYVEIPSSCSKFVTPEKTIVFNIAPIAINDFDVSEEFISYKARFSGIVKEIKFPFAALRSIYSVDFQVGIDFPNESFYEDWVRSQRAGIQILNDDNNSVESPNNERQTITEDTKTKRRTNILKVLE